MVSAGKYVRTTRILCIDGDAEFALLLKCTIERFGHQVTTFTDAASALGALDENPGTWDMVITDYHMPGTSGLAVARHLKQHHPQLPFAVISHHITDHMIAAATDAGVRLLRHKPTAPAQFADLVGMAAG